MSSVFLVRSAALAVTLVSSAHAGARAQTATPVTTSSSVATLPPMVTRASSFMAEIERHIADSSALANMSSRDRFLQLQKDNRYLERVLKDQDRRLDALEKRLAALKNAKAKLEAEATPDQEGQSSRDRELESALARAERFVGPSSGPPATPPAP